MEIHPAVAFGSVIAGAALLGALGALIALPAAATIQAFIGAYINRQDLVDSPLLEDPPSAESVSSKTKRLFGRRGLGPRRAATGSSSAPEDAVDAAKGSDAASATSQD
jgi:hypothetical protein